MAVLFVLGLLACYRIVFRQHLGSRSALAITLWFLYVGLGFSGIFIALTEGIKPIFDPNYVSVFVLLIGINLSIFGFLRFRAKNISQMFGKIHGQRFLENLLIISQLLAIGFFLPFSISSLVGDANENRLLINAKIEVLGSYGLLNTMAGAASQLFSSSLVMAFIRLASKDNQGRSVFRAALLIFCSFSYVIYILAYVGRDGLVYWLMTFIVIYSIFHCHLRIDDRKKIIYFGLFFVIVMSVPFAIITIARFFDVDQGAGWSFFEYFGAQIHNFSDYSSIERPITYGFSSFPVFVSTGCAILGLDCLSWSAIQDSVFHKYLSQGKAPWVFGTFVSDFVGDFGNIGALVIIVIFSLFCTKACTVTRHGNLFSLSRLLVIVLLFLIPYWGVFYFRFSIANGYFIVNGIFIIFVSLLQRLRLKN